VGEGVVIGKVSEVPLGSVRRFDVAGLAVAVVHVDEGIFALEDRCSHADVALSEGELDGCLLECWLHGSAFDVRTGVPQSLPALTPVKTFPISADTKDPNGSITISI
jgi:3-phenylpropionate/trans-cinnamate dioxygenase ferredoxin component